MNKSVKRKTQSHHRPGKKFDLRQKTVHEYCYANGNYMFIFTDGFMGIYTTAEISEQYTIKSLQLDMGILKMLH